VAHLALRKGGRVDIRESVLTPAGPRSRTLASFRGTLTPEVLDRAEARAERPFDRARLVERAGELGVPTTARREDRAARQLLAHLRRGGAIDPVLVTLLRGALRRARGARVPEELAELTEWLGVDDARRGEALRGLLRVSDRALRGRAPLRVKPRSAFPRLSSRGGKRR
jgi:hypothetical protein